MRGLSMLSKKNSIYFFIFACIPARILLALIPLYIPKHLLFFYSFVLGAIGTSFLYLYFANKRLIAFEAGGHTWWAKYRIIHGMLYLIASVYAYNQNRNAWIPLFMDVVVGIWLFVQKRFLAN